MTHSAPRILMCRPTYYGIEYEINPWMSRQRQVNPELADQQWESLHALIETCGATIETVEPVEGLPDLVFTANAAMIHGTCAIVSRFRHPQRQREEAYFRDWFKRHAFQVLDPPSGTSFEGAGDALYLGDTLFAGYLTRSDAKGQQEIGGLVGSRVIPLELIDPYYYHLDTCFCPLNSRQAIYFPGAFDTYGRTVLQELVPELIEVPEAEAKSFACNAVVIGSQVITNIGCPTLHDALRNVGFTPLETPLGEFVKAGGSAKCLTLRLDGEEAASWKQ